MTTHTTGNGFIFQRNKSKYVYILSLPETEKNKGLIENCYLYSVSRRTSDGSIENMNGMHTLSNVRVQDILKDYSSIIIKIIIIIL